MRFEVWHKGEIEEVTDDEGEAIRYWQRYDSEDPHTFVFDTLRNQMI